MGGVSVNSMDGVHVNSMGGVNVNSMGSASASLDHCQQYGCIPLGTCIIMGQTQGMIATSSSDWEDNKGLYSQQVSTSISRAANIKTLYAFEVVSQCAVHIYSQYRPHCVYHLLLLMSACIDVHMHLQGRSMYNMTVHPSQPPSNVMC